MDGESEFAAALEQMPTDVGYTPAWRHWWRNYHQPIRRALLLADKVKREPSERMLEAGVDDGQNWGFDISALNMKGFLKAMVKQAEKELANAD